VSISKTLVHEAVCPALNILTNQRSYPVASCHVRRNVSLVRRSKSMTGVSSDETCSTCSLALWAGMSGEWLDQSKCVWGTHTFDPRHDQAGLDCFNVSIWIGQLDLGRYLLQREQKEEYGGAQGQQKTYILSMKLLWT
jgi:hypothetical protein